MKFPLLLFSGIVCTLCSAGAVAAETPRRPGASQLFPGDALVYARLEDAEEFQALVGESSVGRMLADPAVRPLVEEAYGIGAELFERLRGQVGVSLDELLSIPQGEVAIAVVPLDASGDAVDEAGGQAESQDESPEAIRRRLRRRRRSENAFGLMGVIDAGGQAAVAEQLLERLGDRLLEGRYVYREAAFDGIAIDRYAPPTANRADIEFCVRDGVVLFAVGEGLVESMLARWQGETRG